MKPFINRKEFMQSLCEALIAVISGGIGIVLIINSILWSIKYLTKGIFN